MNRIGCALTYDDSQRLIHQICWKWQRQHGGDHEDLVSVANEAYMRAYNTFDQSRARWSTLLYTVVWNALVSQGRSQARRKERYCEPDRLARIPAKHNILQETLSELSTDAQAVAQLVLETPTELYDVLIGSTPKGWKQGIRAYLYGLGWTAARIARSFAEVHEALS